ncbi:MAG: SRPBCC domain-containing protein [Myxococcota bacterium]|nr:SRPBCC domain-containing protein [Myxococcota bacterium]
MSPETTATVRVTRRFRVAPWRVFDSWLDPDKIHEWMLAPAPGETTRIDVDPRVGGSFCFVVRREGAEVEHAGEYLELVRPRRLAFTWGVFPPGMSTPGSKKARVNVDLIPAGTGTELTLTQDGVPADFASQTESGWNAILESIGTILSP